MGAGVWAGLCKWIRQSPFLWRQESLVWSLSCKSWLCWLPISSQGSVSKMPIYSILECFHGAAGTSFFLEFMSPFLTQGWIPSWLPFAYSAAVLAFPTRAFQSLYFTISLPKPSWIFLSRGWDLAHCHFSSDFAHLLCLNPLVDLGKRGCLWQFLPTRARLDTWPSHLESSGWKFKLENPIS